MPIKTKYLGQVEVKDDQIIQFPHGILGFENHKEFILLNIDGNNHFKILQSYNDENIAFFVVNPWDFFKDYTVDVLDEELLDIKVISNEEKELEILNIITLGSSLDKSTANLLAPVIINTKEKTAKQFVQNNTLYTTKHQLLIEGQGD